MNLVQHLENKGIAHPPKWLSQNIMYLTEMGSVAYGTATEYSDVDMYGFCIPAKTDLFPHLKGEIPGFGRQIQRFEQYQEHHLKEEDKEYDLQIFSIVKFFQLCMENNPNVLDALFVPSRCIRHITQVGQMMREKRKLFLHKGSYEKMTGYAHSQMNKMRIKNPDKNGKRVELIEKFGYDIKFAMHLVRLSLECEQILVDHDLDIERNRELLKSVRRGEWKEQDVYDWFAAKEKVLENLYQKSTLQHRPDEDIIKQLLLDCLEHHYGSLQDAVVINGDSYREELRTIRDKLNSMHSL